jgi:glycosyltransferase involved in cell wall biosynthesis
VHVATQVESLRALGVECEVLVLEGSWPGKLLAGARRVRRALEGPFDLIHAHHAWCGAAGSGHGVPLVLSLLGSDILAFPWRNDGHGPFSRAINRTLARRAAARAAAVVVKAEWMRRALGVPAHVLPNGVDLLRFRPAAGPAERRALRAELRFPADAHIVVFGADPARPRKRFPLAEAAVREAERRLAAAPGVPARPLRLLAVHGRPHDEVARVFRAADLLLFTSDVEGSPNVVKEAMASGLAVVSVDVVDTAVRLAGVSGCRIARDNPEALSAAAAELLAGSEPRGGRVAVAELSLQRVAEKVLALYATVTAGRSASAAATPRWEGRGRW